LTFFQYAKKTGGVPITDVKNVEQNNPEAGAFIHEDVKVKNPIRK